MGTCITDGRGNLASSGAGIPGFVGVLDKAVKRIIELNGEPGEIAHGDVFATNDPFYGGVTHLNDVVLAMPVFAGDELVAWTANMAHWNDVGGMVPGSISNEATRDLPGGTATARREADRRGHADQVRDGDHEGATAACRTTSRATCGPGIAAVRVGEKRILELVEKYGVETFSTAMSLLHGLRRAGLAARARGISRRAVQHRGGAGQRRRLQARPSRSPTTSSSSTCATTRTRIPARTTAAATRR